MTHVLPNSLHFRHGVLLSHFTFNLEHSSHACRFRPRSRELGIAEFPRRSHRLKWSRRTSLKGEDISPPLPKRCDKRYLRLNVLEQNLQPYGLSPESIYTSQLISCSAIRSSGAQYVVVGGGGDGPFAGRSSHIDHRSKGFEPPLRRNHYHGCRVVPVTRGWPRVIWGWP